MSRTYRKNRRWFYKFRGVFCYSSSNQTIKGKAKNYYEVPYKGRIDTSDEFATAYWEHFGVAHFYEEVIVCDSENFTIRRPSDVKKLCRRIDRARAKQSIRNGGDGFHKSSYDPWDWD